MSEMKALPWSMSIHPRWLLMSMGTGVEGGSTLVPEFMRSSSTSMRLVAGFIMSMFMLIADVGVLCCGACMSMPGMSCMGGCVVCARRPRLPGYAPERGVRST